MVDARIFLPNLVSSPRGRVLLVKSQYEASFSAICRRLGSWIQPTHQTRIVRDEMETNWNGTILQGREKIHFYPKMKRRSLQNAIAKQKWLAKHSMLRVCNVNHRPNRSEYKCCREFSLVLRFQPCIYFRNETFYAYRRSSNRKMRFKSNRNNLFCCFSNVFSVHFALGKKKRVGVQFSWLFHTLCHRLKIFVSLIFEVFLFFCCRILFR